MKQQIASTLTDLDDEDEEQQIEFAILLAGSSNLQKKYNPLKKSIAKDFSISRIPLMPIDYETLKRRNKKQGVINADEYFKDRYKLSLKDGKFCIFEHIDKNPIFVNNFGMVSKLHRYIYNERKFPPDDFLSTSDKPKLRHIGPFGL